MKITKYKVKSEDLQDAIIAGILFIAVVIYFVEKHRREGSCTNCQQSKNAQQSDDEKALMDFLTIVSSRDNVTPVVTEPLTVDQIRNGAL